MNLVALVIISIILGQCVAHLCKKLPDVVAENITYEEFGKDFFNDFKIDIKYSLIFIIFSLFAIFYGKFVLLKAIYYLLVFGVLAIVFSIDYRFELIPDECQVALIFLGVLKILARPGTLINSCIAAAIGFLSFWLLGKIALIIYKKEGMGYGDVKLMTGLGLIFGIKNIITITMISFVVGAVISLGLMIFAKKGMKSYIPFGPFIVIGALLIMFVPAEFFIQAYINFCAGLSNGISELFFNLFYK